MQCDQRMWSEWFLIWEFINIVFVCYQLVNVASVFEEIVHSPFIVYKATYTYSIKLLYCVIQILSALLFSYFIFQFLRYVWKSSKVAVHFHFSLCFYQFLLYVISITFDCILVGSLKFIINNVSYGIVSFINMIVLYLVKFSLR